MMFLWEPTCVNFIHEYEFLQKKSRSLRYMLGHEKLKCRIRPMLGLTSINEKKTAQPFLVEISMSGYETVSEVVDI